jgi:hypothetical protein
MFAGYTEFRRALGSDDALEKIAAYISGLMPRASAAT